MQTEQWVTLAAAVVAVVSLLLCALLARRTTRLGREVQGLRERAVQPSAPPSAPAATVRPEPPTAVVTTLPERRPTDRPSEPVGPAATPAVPVPSQEQVRDATLGRPLVRSAVVAHGVWYALRPESRDRVRGIVRREFRRRKRSRLAAGRRAARTAPVDRAAAQAWLGSSTPGPSTPGGER